MMAAADLVCSCGNLRSVCSDPARDWHPQESTCWVAATREWGVRRVQDRHKNFDYQLRVDGELMMGPLDGVSVWVSDIDFEALSVDRDVVEVGGVSDEVQLAADGAADVGPEAVL